MKYVLITMLIIAFMSGKFYGENKAYIKKAAKRARRDAIIRMKNRIVNDMMMWQQKHGDKPLMLKAKNGCITYKCNGYNWNEFEFQKELEKELEKGCAA